MSAARLEVFPQPEVFDRASTAVAEGLRTAIDETGTGSIALSGGSTPVPMFTGLSGARLRWSAVDVFQVDERVAPSRHPDRNLTVMEREFRDRIEGHKPRVHAMDVTTPQLADAALAYGNTLERVCGSPPVVDVVHLGLGADGHIASLIPADPVLDVRDHWISVTRPYGGYVRMTMTYPVLDNARLVVFVVTGEDKAGALAAMLAGDRSVPAGRLAAANVVVFADPAANGER